jgi:hypothetical protein
MTSTVPFEILEERAAQQRRQLHNSVNALRATLRERLDVKKNAREYLLPASGAVALVGLAIGWGIGGIFARD